MAGSWTTSRVSCQCGRHVTCTCFKGCTWCFKLDHQLARECPLLKDVAPPDLEIPKHQRQVVARQVPVELTAAQVKKIFEAFGTVELVAFNKEETWVNWVKLAFITYPDRNTAERVIGLKKLRVEGTNQFMELEKKNPPPIRQSGPPRTVVAQHRNPRSSSITSSWSSLGAHAISDDFEDEFEVESSSSTLDPEEVQIASPSPK